MSADRGDILFTIRGQLRETSALLAEARRRLAADPGSDALRLTESSLQRRKDRLEADAAQLAQEAFDAWVNELLELKAKHVALDEPEESGLSEIVPADELVSTFLAANPLFEIWREGIQDYARNSSTVKAYGGFPLSAEKWRLHRQLQIT
ncbi:MAG: hypothetical protein KY476_24785 [Planctomycetes bacterium]|nr:hypothetical protein [Planctomycetota bacterium]